MFKISKCYQTITPESAENGEYESQGFVFENEIMDFHDLIREIKNENYSKLSWKREDKNIQCVWISSESYTSNYRTCEEKSYSLHFHPEKEFQWKYWKKALKYCSIL